MAREKKAATDLRPPKGKYHVLGIDSFEPPGEGRYLIDVCDSREAAEKSKAEHAKENKNDIDGDKLTVVGPPEDP